MFKHQFTILSFNLVNTVVKYVIVTTDPDQIITLQPCKSSNGLNCLTMPEILNCVKGFKSSLRASIAKCKWADSVSRRHNCITANEEETGAIPARVALLFRTSRYPLIWLDNVKFKLPDLAHLALHNLSRVSCLSRLTCCHQAPHTHAQHFCPANPMYEPSAFPHFTPAWSLFWCFLEKLKCHCLLEAFQDSPDESPS